jgi:hypothetical protein
MLFENLTDDNFMLYAVKCYDTPNCVLSEFHEDIKRIKYLKRLIRKYKQSGDLKERLILNHIIVLGNVFGTPATIRMLFFKLEEPDYALLKTFLIFLDILPEVVPGINGKNIHTKLIPVDMDVANRLRAIIKGIS